MVAPSPATVAETLLSFDDAVKAPLEETVPRACNADVSAPTSVCRVPRSVAWLCMDVRLFVRAVTGNWAIALARVRTFCRSEEYWLTPANDIGAVTAAALVGVEETEP